MAIGYAAMIHRHYDGNLKRFPSKAVLVLQRCGLEDDGMTIQLKNGAPVAEEVSYRYKQAIREFLGEGAYAMTKVNFILAGCHCRDCSTGL